MVNQRFDVWVYLKVHPTGYKAQYFGEVTSDPGDIVDALRVLFGVDMVGADIRPLHVGEQIEEDDE